MDNQTQQTTKPNRKYKNFYEGAVPSGYAQYDISGAKWKNRDTGDVGQDIYVNHVITKGQERGKLIGKMKLPMNRKVLKAFIHHLEQLHNLSPETVESDDDWDF